MGRHLLRHVGITAVVILILTAFGMSWASALTFGLLAGCLFMAFGMNHTEDTRTDENTPVQERRAHQH